MKKIAIIGGNHLINSQKEIAFDKKAINLSVQKKSEFGTSNVDIIYLFDHMDISIEKLSVKKPKKDKLLKQKENLVEEISSKMIHGNTALFEASLKQKAKNNQKQFSSILGKSTFVEKNELIVCVCWGLMAIVILYLLDTAEYEKVVLITSTDSIQLKVSDVIKVQQFFQNHPDYKDKFELVWAK